MTKPDIPPIPDKLLRRLSEPVARDQAFDFAPDPGTVWEVYSPNGELLLFLIVERIESEEADAVAFVRAVPLTDAVHPACADCAIIAVGTGSLISTAHCWLEGPVRVDALVRCLGRVTSASLDAVTKARDCQVVQPVSASVAALRESLYEQFDPVFAASWEKLYSMLETPESGSVVDTHAVSRTRSVRRPHSSQSITGNVQFILAAGGDEPTNPIIDRLAAYEPEDVSSVDYRWAWAHFLASTYRETACRDGWRNAFVSLASDESALDPHWMERLTKAKALTEDRDWKRRYAEKKVFLLEPIPLEDEAAFATLLADFVDHKEAN